MIIDTQPYCGETQLWHIPELCSKIIQSMTKDYSVILRSKECRSCIDNGLFKLLDELCYYWSWDPSTITIETVNPLERHSKYNIVIKSYNDMFRDISKNSLYNIIHKPWNKEKVYGMFLGRANVTRIRGVHNHNTFKYKDKGLTSFHHDLKYHIDDSVLIEYLSKTDQKFSEMTSISPYSDIGKIKTPPITGAETILNWSDVYEKIGIELVFETSESSNNLTISEKLLRPILYKRPFILITGQNNIQRIKDFNIFTAELGKSFNNNVDESLFDELRLMRKKPLRFFENVIDIRYDELSSINRVDQAFSLIETLIDSGNIDRILEDCHEDIEHNYNYIINQIPLIKHIEKQSRDAFDYTVWNKK